MWLLADLFHDVPEVADLDKPKLVFFFDEAHPLFDEASTAFQDAIEQTVRLIRSKGVGESAYERLQARLEQAPRAGTSCQGPTSTPPRCTAPWGPSPVGGTPTLSCPGR